MTTNRWRSSFCQITPSSYWCTSKYIFKGCIVTAFSNIFLQENANSKSNKISISLSLRTVFMIWGGSNAHSYEVKLLTVALAGGTISVQFFDIRAGTGSNSQAFKEEAEIVFSKSFEQTLEKVKMTSWIRFSRDLKLTSFNVGFIQVWKSICYWVWCYQSSTRWECIIPAFQTPGSVFKKQNEAELFWPTSKCLNRDEILFRAFGIPSQTNPSFRRN